MPLVQRQTVFGNILKNLVFPNYHPNNLEGIKKRALINILIVARKEIMIFEYELKKNLKSRIYILKKK